VVDVDVDELHNILVVDLAQELQSNGKRNERRVHSYVAGVW
jgi:hypothetical protein